MKRTSKRRWIARFKLGELVPRTALVEYRELEHRLRPAIISDYSNTIRRAALGAEEKANSSGSEG